VGPTGATGPQGSEGATGATGPQGATGAGIASTITGTTNTTGVGVVVINGPTAVGPGFYTVDQYLPAGTPDAPVIVTFDFSNVLSGFTITNVIVALANSTQLPTSWFNIPMINYPALNNVTIKYLYISSASAIMTVTVLYQ
jgi:hypothetical protein